MKQEHIISHLQNQYGYFIAKRCADILFSFFLIAVLYPWLMPILMLFIKLDSKGPIFFHQKRTGYLGRTFTCTKLRTMILNQEADSRQATEDDARITRIGKFLRKTGLDELPQFISVLKGDMSLIGPRPHMIQDTEHFSSLVKDYNLRHLVRPGITGMAQIKGYRGATENLESIYRRYQWDTYYVRNTSWVLDVKILSDTILLTLQYMVRRGPAAKGQKRQTPPQVKLGEGLHGNLALRPISANVRGSAPGPGAERPADEPRRSILPERTAEAPCQ